MNLMYWLTHTKWGIFAGCTFFYVLFAIVLYIAHRREVEKLMGVLHTNRIVMTQLRKKFGIKDEDIVNAFFIGMGMEQQFPDDLYKMIAEGLQGNPDEVYEDD